MAIGSGENLREMKFRGEQGPADGSNVPKHARVMQLGNEEIGPMGLMGLITDRFLRVAYPGHPIDLL